MTKKISQYFNIYVVAGLIGSFSILYLFSLVFVLNDLSGGSSLKMKKELMKKQQQEICLENPSRC